MFDKVLNAPTFVPVEILTESLRLLSLLNFLNGNEIFGNDIYQFETQMYVKSSLKR